jgi:hypothetical protein
LAPDARLHKVVELKYDFIKIRKLNTYYRFRHLEVEC